ncbi:MAG: hypothetical protein NZM43_06215 [Saprospiraceae bacterium]|nr:hypothetical protein [Saprospiraceae bacterium]MDW8483905.1 hypothetical protein [Saprospiraceae bacterium]
MATSIGTIILASGLTLWGVDAALRALSPGVYTRSRYIYVAIALGLSPAFWATACETPQLLSATGLMLWAIAFFTRGIDSAYLPWALGFTLTSVFAVYLEPLLAFTCLPLAVLLLQEHVHWQASAAVGFFLLGALGWAWSQTGAVPLEQFCSASWSLRYFFIKTDGVPNVAILWQPIGHPFFCLPLPALLLLFKRTDISIYARRALFFSLVVLILLFSGLPTLRPVQLLPIYALWLLILFPAWDRFFAYGHYFFTRLTTGLLGLAIVCQVLALTFFIPDFCRLAYLSQD